jgi:striatin 1/3/4
LSFREGNPFEEETVAASFNFLQGLADEDDKGSDEDEEDGSKKNGEVDNGPNENTYGNVDLLDPDQEAAIAEFEFLAHEAEDDDQKEMSHRYDGSEEEYAQELLADSGSATKSLPSSTDDYLSTTPLPWNAMQGNEWKVGIDPMQLSKLKDEYKQDRKNRTKASKRPTHSQLQQMMSSLNKGDEVIPPSIPDAVPMPEASAVDEVTVDGNELPGFAARMPGRKAKMPLLLPDGGAMIDSSGLGLGVLANLPEHIHNEADSQYDTSTNKVWGPRFSLRSHFDCVRSIAFHPTDPLIVTASEDCTLKLWNLQKPPQTKKSSIYDLEPLYTFRGHKGAVWCCCSSACGSYVFSGSSDTTVCRWLLPSVSCDTYGSYGSCEELTDKFRQTLKGHTDAVWDLRVLPGPDGILVSCAADNTCRLWRHDAEEPLLATIRLLAGQPSCVAPIPCDPSHFIVGTVNGQGVVYDAETKQAIVTFNGLTDEIGLQRINRVASHPTLPVTITAHEDRHLRFFDNRTGNRLHSMVAHLDGVTSLAVDPNGLFVASGSHDCSLRLWNFDTKTCVQEMTAHRKKYEESICDIAFHSVKPMIGSAGADAIAKVFM